MVYLGLGSNLGDKRVNIMKALSLITERVGDILALSDFYKSQSWGYESLQTYLNVAIALETELTPEDLLVETQQIEYAIGRKSKTIRGQYQDRVIDIDILLYKDRIIQTSDLTIPHPLLHQRQFVLKPLSEIAAHVIHPILNTTITELFLKI